MQKSLNQKLRSLLMILTVAVLALLFGLADPAEVWADDITISEDTTTQELIGRGMTEEDSLYLEGNVSLEVDNDLAIKQISGRSYNLDITGDRKLTLKNDVGSAIDIKNLTVSGADVTAITEMPQCHAVYAWDSVTINSGGLTATSETGDGSGIHCEVGFTITDGSVTATGNIGIECRGVVQIKGVNIEISAGDVGISSSDHEVIFSGPETYVYIKSENAAVRACSNIEVKDGLEIFSFDPADYCEVKQATGTTDKNYYFYIMDTDIIAHELILDNPGPEMNVKNKKGDKDKKDDKKEDSGNSDAPNPPKAAATNPLSLTLVTTTGLPYDTFAARAEQGLAARLAFSASRPAGYAEGFSFNLLTNGKADYSPKIGAFTMLIPKDLQKSGRTFAIIALDKNGKTFLLPDADKDPNTITVALNLEGYAFALIYKD